MTLRLIIMLQMNTSDKKITRGGSPFQLFGVDCDEKFFDDVAQKLEGFRVQVDEDSSILDILPPLEGKNCVDLDAEIDNMYGTGVSCCLRILGVKLTSAIVCGCGKLGVDANPDSTSLFCSSPGIDCKTSVEHEYQDIHPSSLARTVAMMTGHIELGTDLRFLEMLGALAGYPFMCACGNLVTWTSAPCDTCPSCVSSEGPTDFVRHMEAIVGAPYDGSSILDKLMGGVGKVKAKIEDTGSYVYGLIVELITTVGNYFNSALQHLGSQAFEGMRTGFMDCVKALADKLKRSLGADGLLFLFVAIVVGVLVKFGANLVANFIITTTLGLFEMIKHIGGHLFSGFIKIYRTIVERIQAEAPDDESFTKHSSTLDGSIAMIATLFCTFASSAGSVSAQHICKALSSARHVASGMAVAKSALLWLVETLPTTLQTYLWDVAGIGSFECDDEELKQLIVVMRESLLLLRKDSTGFLADQAACKILLTSHTMLTRAVTRNLHGWNSTQNSILRAMLTESREYIARAQACVDKGIGRVEPVGLILEGPPGIGKTALIEVLAAKLCPDTPRSARIYFKNLEERFWSGYSEHPFLVLDDYGAVKNETADASLAADILRIISPGEMALNMPFDKGNVFCKSKVVVLTTNRNMNSPQKILESNKAFMRRFLYVTVSIKEEFATSNGVLNTGILRNMPLEESVKFPHLNFRIHEDFKLGRNEGAGLYNLSTEDRSLDELLTVIQAHIVKKESDAAYLHDAAGAVAPSLDSTRMQTKLVGNIVNDEVFKEVDATPDDVCSTFITHMDHKHVDDNKTRGYYLDDNDLELPVEGKEVQSDWLGEVLAQEEMLTHVPVLVPDFTKRPNKYPKTSGGNKLGSKARRRFDEERKAQEESAKKDPTIDEFGIAWDGSDIILRSARYLETRAKTVYVKASSLKDHSDRFKKSIMDAAMEVLSKLKDSPLKCVASVVGCATTIALCLKAFKMVTESTHEPQMRTKYDSSNIRRRPAIAHARRYGPLIRHNLDTETDKAVVKKVAANCGYLERSGGRVGCFFVKGNILRTVTHFFRTNETSDKWLPDGTPFSVFAREGDDMVEYKMSFSMDFVLPYEDDNGLLSDWLYYNCGTKVPPKKDMTGMHLNEKLFTHRRDFRSVLLVRTDGVSSGTHATVRCIANSPAVQYSSVDGTKRPDVYVPTAILSNYQCDHGDCGYPVIGKVDGQYKILSLHVGVRSRPMSVESTSAVVSIGEVNECLELLDSDFPITKHGPMLNVTRSEPAVALNDSYTYIGKLDWAPKGISSKTKYKRSLIYDEIPKKIFYEPSIMGDSEDVRSSKTPKDVLADIANRADASLNVMPKKLVTMAGDALFESIVTQIPVNDSTFIRTLSLDEALNGDGNFVDRYPTAGSPGIPSTLTRKHGVTGKHGIMDQDAEGKWFISDTACAERIEDLHRSFSDGIVAPYVNQFCIKDETLKCNEEGVVKKTRGIKCAPIESNICGKRYFGGMVCLFKAYFDRIPFKCGMNVFSTDWDDFIKWHLEVGDVGFDGDIGGQENIIKGEIYDELYRFTNRIYAHYGQEPTDEEKRQRASYLTSLCHYYMVIGPDLFRAKFGNPSGNWLTSFICSFTSGILLGVAYFGLALKHDPSKANVYYFLTLVRMSLSGDDNFVSRSSLIDWFNGRNVSEHLLEEYGYKYTDARKAEVFPEDRDVIMLNFLACNTRLSDDYPGIVYMAYIDDGPLEKCVQYVSRKAADGDEYLAIVDNANTALDLVWTSGRARFDEYRSKYQQAFIDTPNCNVPVLHDYKFCEERFLRKELLTEDYFCDDYLFIPHMLKAPEQVNAEFQDAQVRVEAGPETKTDDTVTYKGTENTVLEPAKRFSPMYDCPEVKSPVPAYVESVSAAFLSRVSVAGDFRPMAGTLAWFAAPFAAWSGDLRLGVKCAGEVLIRTDATERLANASTLPKQIASGISSMSPFDYTSANEQWALMQIPSTIPYKYNVLPKLTGEEKYRQTTTASFIVETPTGADRPNLTVFAAAGDNYSTHFLFMVPSILVGDTYYPHNRNYEDSLPEYVKLINEPTGPAFPFTQATIIANYKNQGVVESDGPSVNSLIYRTEVFSDADLVTLGIATVAPTNRRYDPGAVKEVSCDLKDCVARSAEIEVVPGGPSTGAATFNLNPTSAVVRGTSYVASPTEMAQGWYLTYVAYSNSLVRSLLNGTGIPGTELVIPTAQSGFEHEPAASSITPATNPGASYLGGEFFIWDATAGYNKAFYDTRILPFKARVENKEDYDFVKHMDSDHGIGFTNVVPAGVATTDRKPKVARKEMGEEKYSFDSFADRYQLIRTFQWTDTQPQGTILDSRSVPYQCIGSTTATAFNKFCYWSGDVELKIQVQSTAFVCGKLIVVFAPLCDPTRAAYLQLPSLVSMSVAPNVTVMAGNTTEVTMLIPYAHYKNYLNTDGEAGDPFSLLGSVSIVVFNKLRVAAGGVDYCTVNVYSRFRNSNFQMLRPPPIEGNVAPHEFVKHGGAMSMAKNVSGVVDDVTDAVSRVGAVAEYALDAPNVGVNYTPVFKRAAPMLNHSTNVHYMNVMDMHPGQQSLADSKDVASTVPECSIKYLLTKPSYLNTFSIKDSDIEGEVYMVAPLTPAMKLFNAPNNSLVDETLMGYTAIPFKYWRGGFKFIIEVVATSVHTGRLVVATHYGGASSSVGMDGILAQNAEVLEIGAGQNTFEVIVPWRVPTQWLEVPGGPPESINPFEVTSAARYSMGEVSIRLLTRLQTMPSVTPEIDCNVYVSMLDDAELAYIGMNTADLRPVLVPNQKIVP